MVCVDVDEGGLESKRCLVQCCGQRQFNELQRFGESLRDDGTRYTSLRTSHTSNLRGAVVWVLAAPEKVRVAECTCQSIIASKQQNRHQHDHSQLNKNRFPHHHRHHHHYAAIVIT